MRSVCEPSKSEFGFFITGANNDANPNARSLLRFNGGKALYCLERNFRAAVEAPRYAKFFGFVAVTTPP